MKRKEVIRGPIIDETQGINRRSMEIKKIR
jgi:hypothetical protein